MASVAVLGLIVLATLALSPDEEPIRASAADGPAASEPVTELTESTLAPSTTSTMAEAETSSTTVTSVASPTTARPGTTTTSGPAARRDDGPVVTADRPGLWVVDVLERTVRWVADDAAFDLAGDDILHARGFDLVATPVSGGDTVLRYAVEAGRGQIILIEAGPDGSAVLGTSSPVVGADGTTVASGVLHDLYTPDGRRVELESRPGIPTPGGPSRALYLSSPQVEWNRDGSLLAISHHGDIYAVHPDGRLAYGPMAYPAGGSGPYKYRWTYDGTFVASLDGRTFSAYDEATRTWTPIPGFWIDIDFAPDGRVVGPREADPATPWLMTDLVVRDPATGNLTTVGGPGWDPFWSPDGRWIRFAESSPESRFEDPDTQIRVVDASGSTQLIVRQSKGLMPGGAEWSASGRYLVIRESAAR